MARKGEEVPLKAKLLRIDEIELLDASLIGDAPTITLRIVCSKGTYIRALARDIGLASAAARTLPRSAARKWAMCAWKIVIVSTISNNGSHSKRSKPNYLNKIPDAPLAFRRKGAPVAGNKTHTAA